MRKTIEKHNFDKERIILHRLLLSSSMINNVGLLWGKTGVMFFFMHYYRYTGDTMYEDVALELLDEVEEKLQKGLLLFVGLMMNRLVHLQNSWVKANLTQY